MKLATRRLCSLCNSEMTDIGIIVYEEIKPLCEKCILFIKKTKIRDFRK